MASGIPSRCLQSWPTVASFSAVTAKPGTTETALSAKRRTASGLGRGGTVKLTSPLIPSGRRLVTRIRSSGQLRRSVSASTAHASRRCSTLSSTMSACFGARYSARVATSQRADWSRKSRASNMACVTSAGSSSAASSANQTPSRKARWISIATRRPSRVFPTPPMPVSVRSREPENRRLISANSWRRPTKLVIPAGTLCKPRSDREARIYLDSLWATIPHLEGCSDGRLINKISTGLSTFPDFGPT